MTPREIREAVIKAFDQSAPQYEARALVDVNTQMLHVRLTERPCVLRIVIDPRKAER